MTVNVLFVCMGNICRSPTAHAVFRRQVLEVGLADHFEIDSAGTHAYHIGNPPDARAMATARQRGIAMDDLEARQVSAGDFELFDYILAMDIDNLRLLQASCPREQARRLSLMLDWVTGWGEEVPDPYYGGDAGFEHVFDMLTEACRGLLTQIISQRGLSAGHPVE
jgi:protein-tyrosine phosphatase